VHIYSTNLTANRNLTLSLFSVENGSIFRVVRLDAGAFTLTVKSQSGTTLKVLSASQWADFLFDGNFWLLEAFGTYSAGAAVAVSSAAIAFTDGDTSRRVTITDASVSPTSEILLNVRRPDTDEASDRGYIYLANVVKRAAGSFDVVISSLGWGFDDPAGVPPNETFSSNTFLAKLCRRSLESPAATSLQKSAEGVSQQTRSTCRGESVVSPLGRGTYSISDEGSYFKATNPAPSTGIAHALQGAFSDTTNVLFVLRNTDGEGAKRLYLDYVKLLYVSASPTAATAIEAAVKIDNTNRYSSGGTAITPSTPTWTPPRRRFRC